ncbi:ROK family glucokinase [Pseudonocardia sulfidoxydans]|uniref:ROK family glucokinase n=1 Tax=Pseudonocardia sulfidoxydans TaxID=54011 RepID=UPI003618427B
MDRSGAILAGLRRPTPREDAAQIRETIVGMVEELRAGYNAVAIGVAAAGFVDADRSTIRFAPNLSWRNAPLREELEQRTGLPVVVENDANAAAWGEARFGAGRGHDHLVALTVGTGVGGGIVANDVVIRGHFGAAAEVGHIVMVPNGRACPCGLRGCLEQYASGRALARHARSIATAAPTSAAGLITRAGGRVDAIDGTTVTAAALEGDPTSLRAFEEVGSWLGRGIAQLAAVLDPALFVLSGGVTRAGKLLLEPAVTAYHQNVTGRGLRPLARVELAELGADAGLVGVADLAAIADIEAEPYARVSDSSSSP